MRFLPAHTPLPPWAPHSLLRPGGSWGSPCGARPESRASRDLALSGGGWRCPEPHQSPAASCVTPARVRGYLGVSLCTRSHGAARANGIWGATRGVSWAQLLLAGPVTPVASPSQPLLHRRHRIPECQGLAGPSVGHPAQPPAQAGSPRAGCTAPRPGRA